MKYLLTLAAGLLLAAPAASAQSTTAASSSSAAPVSDGQRRAAEELLTVMQMEQTTNSALDQMMTAQLTQRPELKAVEPEMRSFLSKYMSWNSLRPDVVELYARRFTEKELKELKKFYGSATGQKFVGQQGALMAAAIEIGQRRMQEHMPELQQSIETKLKSTQN